MALLGSLRHGSFTLLWGGQTFSRLGDSVYRITLAWWVLEKTGSATAMGKMLIFSYTPMLLFLLVGGVAVDRFHKLKVMLVSDVVRGVIVIVVASLATIQRLEIWHLYLASSIFGTVNAFFQPAYTVIIPQIIPPESLPSANSLTVLSKQFADIGGPTLGAVIVSLGSWSAGFALNGVSFFVSAVCLIPLLNFPALAGPKQEHAGAMRELRQGISTIIKSRWLWFTIGVAALGNATLNGPLSVAMPFLIKGEFHADVRALGLVQSMLAIGSVIGTIWLGRSIEIKRRGLTAYSAWVACGLSVMVIGLHVPLIGVGFAALICGATITAFSLIWTNTLQEIVPREQLGRVSSIDYLFSFGMLPIGFALTGWATDQIGASLVFVVGGAITAGLAVLGLWQREIRRLD